jgi:metallo-beta-lactamase class B
MAGGASPTDLTPLTPTRVFDNLYFVGSGSLSSWAITTSKGIILIDALRNAEEARAVIEPSMRSLGLDPAKIRYLIVTHGHGDHYGGVRYLVDRHRPRVVMSEIDWAEVAKPVLQLDAPHWGRPPVRDIAVRDGHRLRLGDTTVELPVTRTHTPGTISPIFTVRDGRRRHRVLLWGGTGFNFGPSVERLESYGASADRLRLLARRRSVDVLVSNHPRPDGSAARMELLRQREAGAPHPFVIGQARVSAVLSALGTCARVQAQALR